MEDLVVVRRGRGGRKTAAGLAPPPPYEAAMYRQLWSIVAPWVDASDLYAACMVSSLWWKIFAPLLWANPAARFRRDSDGVYCEWFFFSGGDGVEGVQMSTCLGCVSRGDSGDYPLLESIFPSFILLIWELLWDYLCSDADCSVSITRFKRLLPRARLDVRKLAHTLHIPPAQPEFYGGPQDGWLRDLLDRLPSLQALIVSNLSFFDHQALQTVHHTLGSPFHESKYGLKLLIASECENTTASSLTAALFHFPDLMYLDFSSTQGSRNAMVLRQISTLSQLRVLKLRNCGLRDHDMDLLGFSTHLRSLDVSENYLTERGISSLIQRLPAARLPPIDRASVHSFGSGSSRLPSRRPTLQHFVASKLIAGHDGHHYVEDGLPPAFADLYLAGNFLSIDELTKVLRHPSIEFLDCGSLNCSQRHQELLSPHSPASDRQRYCRADVDTLSPALFTEAFRNIKSLRIHYSVITSHPFSGKELPVEEQCFELHNEDLRYELDSTELVSHGLVFELDDTSVHNVTEVPESLESPSDGALEEESPPLESHPNFESPDDVGPALHLPPPAEILEPSAGRTFYLSNAGLSENGRTNADSTSSMKLDSRAARRNAPPPLRISPNHSTPSAYHPATLPIFTPSGPETFRYNYRAGEDPRWEAARARKPTDTTQEIIDEIVQRRHRTEARERHPGRFKPCMLPNLKTLTLTDVPTMTRNQSAVDALITFIQECGEEEELARLEATQHELPHPQHHHHPASLTQQKLQCLVLEMSDKSEPAEEQQGKGGSTGTPRTQQKRHSFTKSSTEDQDSEQFMAASEFDFTFFAEDDGGLLVSAGRIDAPMRVDDGMIISGGGRLGQEQGDGDPGRLIDVVGALAAFRRERKRVYEASVEFGRCGIERALCGYWSGEVKVVR
jgi:hypothetical protein